LPSSSDGCAVAFRDVVKAYRRLSTTGLKHALLHLPSFVREWRAPTIRALDGVSFEVRRGEAFGIVGRNGSGKSTALALMAGVLGPSSGEVRVSGRLAPLLELGAGFHPELSGRENVGLNAAILGLRRREIRARFDAIVDFAGVRDFIDEPLRTYSSGMQMRLGFAVAVHTDPEVLLIDEVLAVGDVEFQRKCLDKMAEFRKAGVTIVLVTHDFSTVLSMCDRAILLERGRVAAAGAPAEVAPEYQRAMA